MSAFQVRPKILTTAEYEAYQKNITEELKKVDQTSNPDEVPRVVISVSSSLNYDDKSSSAAQDKRTQVSGKPFLDRTGKRYKITKGLHRLPRYSQLSPSDHFS